MKSQVFRIIAWGLTLGVTVLWVLQKGAASEHMAIYDELVADLHDVRNKTAVAESVFEEGKAKLLAENVKLQEDDGVVTQEMNAFQKQVDDLSTAIADEEANLAIIKAEGASFPEQLASIQTALVTAQGRLAPLQQEEAAIKASRATEDKSLAEVRSANDVLQKQLDALREIRDDVRRQYEERSAALREIIDEPPWLYYGDKTRSKLINVRPSMTGVFLPLGIGDGVKRGMEFLVRRLNPSTPTKRSWRLKLKIVQSDYSFAVIMPEFGDQDIPVQAGEEVELVRSGNLAREEEENDQETPAKTP